MSTNHKRRKFFRSNSLSKNKAFPSNSPNKPCIPPLSTKFPVSFVSGRKSLNSGSSSGGAQTSRCLEILDRLILTQGGIKNELAYIKEVFEASTEKKYEERIQKLTEENKRLITELTKRSSDNETNDDNNNCSQTSPETSKHTRSKTVIHIGDLLEKISSAGDHPCFQDEFLSKADEFSESWRIMLKDQKT